MEAISVSCLHIRSVCEVTQHGIQIEGLFLACAIFDQLVHDLAQAVCNSVVGNLRVVLKEMSGPFNIPVQFEAGHDFLDGCKLVLDSLNILIQRHLIPFLECHPLDYFDRELILVS